MRRRAYPRAQEQNLRAREGRRRSQLGRSIEGRGLKGPTGARTSWIFDYAPEANDGGEVAVGDGAEDARASEDGVDLAVGRVLVRTLHRHALRLVGMRGDWRIVSSLSRYAREEKPRGGLVDEDKGRIGRLRKWSCHGRQWRCWRWRVRLLRRRRRRSRVRPRWEHACLV